LGRRASCSSRLDLLDLVHHEAQPRHVASQLGQRVRRERHALRRAQAPEPLGRLAQRRLEAPDAEAGQGALDPVHDAGALADQARVLSVRALGILLLGRRDRGHGAVVPFAAQPAEKGALEQLGVEPVCLGPPMLPRHGDARRVNDMGFDAARPQPARQPETVAAGLEGGADARDPTASPGRLVPPTPEQPKQSDLVGLDLLHGLALDGRYDPSDEPACLAQLNDRDERVILLQGNEASAQVVRLRHGTLRRFCSDDRALSSPPAP
jgi:hypothetical protein